MVVNVSVSAQKPSPMCSVGLGLCSQPPSPKLDSFEQTLGGSVLLSVTRHSWLDSLFWQAHPHRETKKRKIVGVGEVALSETARV